jgi:hypothetical protein
MLMRTLRAIGVFLLAALLFFLLGSLLAALGVPVLAAFLLKFYWLLGALIGVWYFLGGGAAVGIP